MQIELHFRIPSETISALRRYQPLRRIAWSVSRVEKRISTYFDTQDLALRDHGLALHILRIGKKCVQRLDCLDEENGANGERSSSFSQGWEAPISDAQLDQQLLNDWLGHEARFRQRSLKRLHPQCVMPIFDLRIGRAIWQLEFNDGAMAQLILDHGEARCHASQQPVSELTLTHCSGSNDAFYAFALTLQHDMQLHPLYRSSVQCGYALRDLSAPHVVTAKSLRLREDVDAAQGLQIVVNNCMQQIQGNAAGVIYNEDAESVHQMRIGLRRLRSGLDIFEALSPCPVEVRNELAWLATALGTARDWHVLDAVTLPALASCLPHVTEMVTLQSLIRQETIRKHHDAALAVDSARSARLWILLQRWLTSLHDISGAQSVDATASLMPLRYFVALHIKRIHKKALRRCKDVQISVPDSRHRVRIASKKLRYATEFFASYYPKKAVARFIDKLSRLQDVLGTSNDTAVAQRLLMSIAHQHAELSETCALVRGYQSALDDGRTQELGKRIRRFATLRKLHLREKR